jgi:hypothetical protein
VSEDVKGRCDICGVEDLVRAVQPKIEGTANRYQAGVKKHYCRQCRKRLRGRWRYWV